MRLDLRKKAGPIKAESWALRLNYAMSLLVIHGFVGDTQRRKMFEKLKKELAKQDAAKAKGVK